MGGVSGAEYIDIITHLISLIPTTEYGIVHAFACVNTQMNGLSLPKIFRRSCKITDISGQMTLADHDTQHAAGALHGAAILLNINRWQFFNLIKGLSSTDRDITCDPSKDCIVRYSYGELVDMSWQDGPAHVYVRICPANTIYSYIKYMYEDDKVVIFPHYRSDKPGIAHGVFIYDPLQSYWQLGSIYSCQFSRHNEFPKQFSCCRDHILRAIADRAYLPGYINT